MLLKGGSGASLMEEAPWADIYRTFAGDHIVSLFQDWSITKDVDQAVRPFYEYMREGNEVDVSRIVFVEASVKVSGGTEDVVFPFFLTDYRGMPIWMRMPAQRSFMLNNSRDLLVLYGCDILKMFCGGDLQLTLRAVPEGRNGGCVYLLVRLDKPRDYGLPLTCLPCGGMPCGTPSNCIDQLCDAVSVALKYVTLNVKHAARVRELVKENKDVTAPEFKRPAIVPDHPLAYPLNHKMF